MTLREAIEMRFPTEEWARRAIVRLGELPEGTVIHDVAHGWLRFGGADGVLVDTLYVLTEDSLGFGQTTAETGQPDWITLAGIRKLDAIEGLPYPLQAVEIQLADDLAMLVGWPEAFCDKVVEVLVAGTAGEGAPSDDEMPEPFADPGTAADRAEVAELDRLGPSEFVEADVAGPRGPADADPVPGAWQPDPVSPESVGMSPRPFRVSPEPVPAADAEPEGYGPLDPAIADRVEEFFEGVSEPLPVAPGPALGDLHPEVEAHEGTPAAFADPGIQWPEPLRPVTYFGDHPAHPRRKKNVTLAFSPSGITAVASGLGTWKIHLPWDEIADLSFETADEVKFTHNHKIHMNSTAVVVVLVDEAHMVFEVRGRRPNGMRSALAPLVNAVHQHRGGVPGSELGEVFTPFEPAPFADADGTGSDPAF